MGYIGPEGVKRVQEAIANEMERIGLGVKQRFDLVAWGEQQAQREAERKEIRGQNLADLLKTGVPRLFEDLRREGVVRWSNEPVVVDTRKGAFDFWKKGVRVCDFHAAQVNYRNDNREVVLGFDNCQAGIRTHLDTLCEVDCHSEVVAEIRDGGLTINGRKVSAEVGSRAEDLIGQEIVRHGVRVETVTRQLH